jgi:phosphatidylglycerol lysyltransferase
MFLKATPRLPLLQEATGASRERALAHAPHAEWGLAHQGAKVLLTFDQNAGWLARAAGPSLVALGLPLGPACLKQLSDTAKAAGRRPLLYKCDKATALTARQNTWRVLRLGEEAILDLAEWSQEHPSCRQLRRKIRTAEKAGIRVSTGCDLPLAEMGAVNRVWSERHGSEKGFSMGRFEPTYLWRQRVFLAHLDGRLIAFATFHGTKEEWTLDLMRHVEDSPSGTMHLLIAAAASKARADGCARLSLAAIPRPLPDWASRLTRWQSGLGLAQFKKSFGPRLAPRYAAAPDMPSLVVGLLAAAWAIHWPQRAVPEPELRDPTLPAARLRSRRLKRRRQWPHFGFDPAHLPCDAQPAKLRPVAFLLSGRRPPS